MQRRKQKQRQKIKNRKKENENNGTQADQMKPNQRPNQTNEMDNLLWRFGTWYVFYFLNYPHELF